MCFVFMFFFFFQAEDGIRDVAVTGVQTCALPIYNERVIARESRRTTPTGFARDYTLVVEGLIKVRRAQLLVERRKRLVAGPWGPRRRRVATSRWKGRRRGYGLTTSTPTNTTGLPVLFSAQWVTSRDSTMTSPSLYSLT